MLELLRERPCLCGGSEPACGAPVLLAPPVHEHEVADDADVAQHGARDHDEKAGRVQVLVDAVLALRRQHVHEAPRTGTVLHVRAETEERREAEERARHVGQRERQVTAARAQASLVEVRRGDGEAALERHAQQQRERHEAEESHGEAEVPTRNPASAQCAHRLVPRVRRNHQRADQEGAQQVGDEQRGEQHLEQVTGRGGTSHALLPPPAPDLQQHERNRVPENPGGEHERGGGGRTSPNPQVSITVYRALRKVHPARALCVCVYPRLDRVYISSELRISACVFLPCVCKKRSPHEEEELVQAPPPPQNTLFKANCWFQKQKFKKQIIK